MNETPTVDPVETPETAAPEVIEPAPSIREHFEEYATKADPSDATDEARPGETEAQAQQRRDKATGQYREGKVRHRAKSQQSSAEDVQVIDAMTKRMKSAEEQFGRDIARKDGESERVYTLRRRAELLERLGSAQQAPPTRQQPQPQQPPPQQYQHQQPQGDFEPQENDPRYESNYALFLRDQAAWIARDHIRQFHAYQQQQQFAQQQANVWRDKVEKAKTKYPDYEQVAFRPSQWPDGSVPDQFIRGHDNGAELLYYLHANPAEIDALSRESVLKQAERLSLILQRLASSSTAAAGTNGAAPGAQIALLPKPPTPLRTEAQRPTTAPPTDGSLPIMQHAKKFKVR